MNPEELVKKVEALEKKIVLLEGSKSKGSNFLRKKRFRMRVIIPLLAISLIIMATLAYAATIPNTFVSGNIASASDVNDNFSYIVSRLWDLSGTGLYFDSGNIGIGTASPDSDTMLHIKNDSAIMNLMARIENTGTGDSYAMLGTKAGTYEYRIGVGSTGEGSWGVSDKWFLYDVNSNLMRMVVDSTGNIGIGTTDPNVKLEIANGALCVDDATDTCTTGTAGYIYATGATITGIDLAEKIPTKEKELENGDIVCLDIENNEHVIKCTDSYSSLVAGVYSTKPGVLLGKEYQGVPVALAGRVPAKISMENGAVKIGDMLTSSSRPGYAMKCDHICDYSNTIGKAMGNIDTDGEIVVLLK